MAKDSIGKMNGAPDPDIGAFTEALRLPPEERDRYLSEACKGDGEFRRLVEALIEAYEQAGDFLGRPAGDRPARAAQAIPAGEKPGDRIGHYKLLQQIGEGGCGVVYLAEQEAPVRRRVALKIIKPGMDTKSVIGRFEAERQALALMNHPTSPRFSMRGRPKPVAHTSRSRNTATNNHSRRRIGLGFLCRSVKRSNMRIRGASSIATSNLPIFS
jgi:hypothetical protein